MSTLRIVALTALTMIAFAGNSLLCRFALRETDIDAASFTTIRLVSGAITLWLIVLMLRGRQTGKGTWRASLALFGYAACFSFAYLELSAATGALLLFGAVQTTMIGTSIVQGERLSWPQWLGAILALGGLIGMLLPGLSAPPILGAALMLCAGVAWGVYSLLGKRTPPGSNPIQVTAGNFLRATAFTAALSLISFLTLPSTTLDPLGVGYAIASGAIASGLGYAIWYTVLPSLKATQAAIVQLSVPVIAAVGGVVFLAESLSLRLVLASVAILGGIALVVLEKRSPPTEKSPTEKLPVKKSPQGRGVT